MGNPLSSPVQSDGAPGTLPPSPPGLVQGSANLGGRRLPERRNGWQGPRSAKRSPVSYAWHLSRHSPRCRRLPGYGRLSSTEDWYGLTSIRQRVTQSMSASSGQRYFFRAAGRPGPGGP